MSGLVGPDVRAGVVEFVALEFGGARFPGWWPDVRGLGRGRMSGLSRPDVQGLGSGRMSGLSRPYVRGL